MDNGLRVCFGEPRREFLRMRLDWARVDMDEDVGATSKSADLRAHVYAAVST